MDTTIYTDYLGPTDTEGSRIRVLGDGKQHTLPYDYAAWCPHEAALQEVFGSGAELIRAAETARGYRWQVTLR